MRTVKCRVCGKEVERDTAILVSPRFYVCSQDCLDEFNKSKNRSSADKSGRKELLDYINKIIPNPNYGVIQKQLKDMMLKYPSYTFGGIKYTLWYIKEIERKELSGIGIVPYYYSKAKEYYNKKQSVAKAIKDNQNVTDSEIVIKRKYDLDKDIFD